MKSILLIPVLLSLFLSACSESKTKAGKKGKDVRKSSTVKGNPTDNESKVAGYSISAPEGWEKIDTTIMEHQITVVRSASESLRDDFLENVNVVTEKTGDISLDDYLAGSLKQMENSRRNFVTKKVSVRSINSIEFRTLEYSHTSAGYTLHVMAYLTIKNGMGYVVTCSATDKSFSRFEADFEQAIRSFSFN